MKFQRKLTAAFLLISALLLSLVIFVTYRSAIYNQKQEIRSKLMAVASMAAYSIDGGAHSKIPPVPEGKETVYFKEIINKLNDYKKINPDIQNIYTMVKTEKKDIWRFIVDASAQDVSECGEEFDVSIYSEMQKAFDGPAVDKDLIADKWGIWISGYAPIKNDKNEAVAVVGVDMSAKTVYDIQKDIQRNAALALIFGIFISVLLGLGISSQIANPINKLSTLMERVKSGDLDQRIHLKTKDELQDLGDNFNIMLRDLKYHIKKLKEVTAEQERMKKELEIAAQLQKSILPSSPPDVKGLDISGICIPAKEIGGDFYDFILSVEHKIGLVIADAAGKGLPGALFMTNSRSVFKAYAREDTSTSRVLEKSNNMILHDYVTSGRFITFVYALYDPATEELTYSNAGHNYPILLRNNPPSVSRLSKHSLPLGIVEDEKIEEEKISLKKGDTLIFFTDGVTEAKDSAGQMFGETNLIETVKESSALPAKQIIKNIYDKILDFSIGQPQYDDFTLIIIKVTK